MVSKSEYVGIKNTCVECGKPVTITFIKDMPSTLKDIFINTEKAKCSVCEPHALWLRD